MTLPGLLVLSTLAAAPAPAPTSAPAPKPAPKGPAATKAVAPAPATPGDPRARPVPSVLTQAPEHPLDISADKLLVLTKESRAVWTGHVHAIRAADPAQNQAELHILCDTLETTYAHKEGDGPQTLQTVTCKEHVQVVQGDRAGWGDLAVFENQKGELVVTGHVRGQQGPNRFSGAKLTFHVDSDQIEVTQATTTVETQGKDLPKDGPGPAPAPKGAPR